MVAVALSSEAGFQVQVKTSPTPTVMSKVICVLFLFTKVTDVKPSVFVTHEIYKQPIQGGVFWSEEEVNHFYQSSFQ